jgi:type VI secretion system protein ImpM
VTGLFGKLPAHGDFVRRGLPAEFLKPWDEWLQAALPAARAALGEAWEAAWAAAPAWRFVLPAGACGPEPVAGVLLPSEDAVGRRFPLTLAAVGTARAGEGWFDALAALGEAARTLGTDAEALAAALPPPGDDDSQDPFPERPLEGWWTRGGAEMPAMAWALPTLPPPDAFAFLLCADAS